MLKYREPPINLAKTLRLLTFLHHLLRVLPISSKGSLSHQHSFPLGALIEDLALTLSLETTPHNPSAHSIWIVTIQFMMSCLRSEAQQHIYNAGVTTPVILGVIKHVLLEMTRLPPKEMDSLQEKCFIVGRELLDLFLIRDTATYNRNIEGNMPSTKTAGLGTISYFDVIYSASIHMEKRNTFHLLTSSCYSSQSCMDIS
jgi:hypothetical protein